MGSLLKNPNRNLTMPHRFPCALLVAMLGLIGQPCVAQSPDDIRELKLKDWQPKSMLKTKVTKLEARANGLLATLEPSRGASVRRGELKPRDRGFRVRGRW